jgi:hypothetical protein
MFHHKSILFAVLAISMACASVEAQDLSGPATGKVYVAIQRNDNLMGAILDLDTLKVETEFGAVSIPMAKVDGIKMHSDAKDNAVIAFKNGDLVTGKVVLAVVKLKTEWGTAHINTDKVETITNTRNARFYSDTSTGKAVWRFTKSPPAGRN